MRIEFYKPNKSNKGSACSFYTKDGVLYSQFVKQNGWNETTGNGIFQNGVKTNVKFSIAEIGAMLDVIDLALLSGRTREASFFHKSQNQNVSIKVAPWLVTKEDKSALNGISLLVTKMVGDEKTSYTIGFTVGEGKALSEFLRGALQIAFADRKQTQEPIDPLENA